MADNGNGSSSTNLQKIEIGVIVVLAVISGVNLFSGKTATLKSTIAQHDQAIADLRRTDTSYDSRLRETETEIRAAQAERLMQIGAVNISQAVAAEHIALLQVQADRLRADHNLLERSLAADQKKEIDRLILLVEQLKDQLRILGKTK